MSDRETELRRLATEISENEGINDAFLAKSFTDRLLVLDVTRGESVPDDVVETLLGHELREAESVYGDGDESRSFVGTVSDGARHHFVDVRTRGDHQSYVID